MYCAIILLRGYMEREIRDLYDSNSQLTGRTYLKGDPIPKGYYHMVVMIAIQNSKNEFLMQKRVPRKGGGWGVTGGHPKSGQTCEEGIITEVLEELGIDISNQPFEEFDSGCDGNDCFKMYYTKLDIKLNDITIQEEELSEVRWFSLDELHQMVKNHELDKNQVDFFLKCDKFIKSKETMI